VFLVAFLFPYKSLPREVLKSVSLAVFPFVILLLKDRWLRRHFRSLQTGDPALQAMSDQAAEFFDLKSLTVYNRVGGEKRAGRAVAPVEGAILLDPFSVELLGEEELNFLIARAHAERKFERWGLRRLVWISVVVMSIALILVATNQTNRPYGQIIFIGAIAVAGWVFLQGDRFQNRDFLIDEMAVGYTGNRPAALWAMIIEQFGKPEPYANLESWPELDPDRYERYQRLKGAV
jgi:hypothetical protein